MDIVKFWDLATGKRPTALTVGDVNLDGFPDLIVGNGAAGTISVLLGNGDGTFLAKQDQAA
ncbi:MAG TPA: FG-GAP repeat protein, partial [Gemmataceae bacterium]|nr:FG-GAP repeat protein [Gemmataceae bacterium]